MGLTMAVEEAADELEPRLVQEAVEGEGGVGQLPVIQEPATGEGNIEIH